jgi:hypothetical protein
MPLLFLDRSIHLLPYALTYDQTVMQHSGISCSCLLTLGVLAKMVFTSLYPTSRSKSTQPTGGYARGESHFKATKGGDYTDQLPRKWQRIDSESQLGSQHRSKSSFGPHSTVVTVTHGRDPSWSGSIPDGIPLTGIRQQKDISRVEERVTTPEPSLEPYTKTDES